MAALCSTMNSLINTKCVVCGRRRSYDTGDNEAWYGELHSNLKVGDVAPNKCIDCYQIFEIGQKVKLRLSFGDTHFAKVGDIGHVKKVCMSEEGAIYEILFENCSEPDLCTQVELQPFT